MGLLAPADQEKLRDAFAEMKHPVKILFFSQTLGCETCPETRQIVDELPPLSDNIESRPPASSTACTSEMNSYPAGAPRNRIRESRN